MASKQQNQAVCVGEGKNGRGAFSKPGPNSIVLPFRLAPPPQRSRPAQIAFISARGHSSLFAARLSSLFLSSCLAIGYAAVRGLALAQIHPSGFQSLEKLWKRNVDNSTSPPQRGTGIADDTYIEMTT